MSTATSEAMDGGITLSELLSTVRKAAGVLVAMTVAGGLVGLGTAVVLPKQWQAMLLVRIGQIGHTAAPGGMQPLGAMPLEATARTAERIKSPAFLDRVARRIASAGSTPATGASFISDSVRVVVPRGTDLLEIRVAGYTPQDARQAAATIVSLLEEDHAHVSQPIIAALNAKYQKVDSELKARVEERAAIEKRLIRGLGRDSGNEWTAAIHAVLIALKDAQILALRDSAERMAEVLSPARTFHTTAIGDIYVGEGATFPRRTQFVVGGAGIGLIIGLGWALYRRRGTVAP